MDTQNVLRTELIREINSLSIDKKDLNRILVMLQGSANEAAQLENNHIQSLKGIDVDYDVAKTNVDKCSVLKITVKGTKGEDLFGSIDEVLNETIFPEQVKSIYVNSKLLYDAEFKYTPRNYFELFIDFTKPRVFDFSILPSDKTPNNSFLKVEGYENTWVNGVYSEVGRFFLNGKKGFIHKANSYDILVWLIGIPFSFWICYKSANIIYRVSNSNTFFANAIFSYIFLVGLLTCRIIFHYCRWVYPMIEFKNEKDSAKMHRVALYTILIGILGSFFYDIISLLFKK